MLISTQPDLDAACRKLSQEPYMTVDTEFMREKTYYPILCLIQLAGPQTDAVAIDPLATGLDLEPLFKLLSDEKILKVFHAARQDLEIFFNLTGAVPHPLFDTQVAAMVCGYGDQIGYTSLVEKIDGHRLDKDAQFTDWSQRPLSKRQLEYALDDVIHLRNVYRHLASELERRNRASWVIAEMQILVSPDTYSNAPEKAWERVKIRTDKPKVLALLREVAAWRETEAQRRDVPRGRILKDETLAEIAFNAPQNAEELSRIRGVGDMARGKAGQALLESIKRGVSMPKDQWPSFSARRDRLPDSLVPVVEMLKMLLKIQCAEHGIVPRLVASTEDLGALAMEGENASIPALHGWRQEVFGNRARDMMDGKIGLSLKNGKIKLVFSEKL